MLYVTKNAYDQKYVEYINVIKDATSVSQNIKMIAKYMFIESYNVDMKMNIDAMKLHLLTPIPNWNAKDNVIEF